MFSLLVQSNTPFQSVIMPYLAVFAVAFIVSLLLTPLMRLLAIRNGVVDWPDRNRKNHGRPIAYLGGAVIFLAWLAGMFTCFLITPHDPRVLALGLNHVSFPISIVIGALVITLTSPVRIVMCLSIIGAVLGFLIFNFHPASIFMGDAGSMLLGYLSISTILLLAHAPASGPALVLAALIVFALPIIDTMLAIVRRLIARRSIFSPDSHHMHHKLLQRGLSVPQATWVLYGLAMVLAATGCSVIFMRGRVVLVLFLLLFTLVPIMAYVLGKRHLRQQHILKNTPFVPAKHASLPYLPRPRRTRKRGRSTHTSTRH